jgi:hypothetical protein
MACFRAACRGRSKCRARSSTAVSGMRICARFAMIGTTCPIVLGHEIVGWVVKVDSHLRQGRRPRRCGRPRRFLPELRRLRPGTGAVLPARDELSLESQGHRDRCTHLWRLLESRRGDRERHDADARDRTRDAAAGVQPGCHHEHHPGTLRLRPLRRAPYARRYLGTARRP